MVEMSFVYRVGIPGPRQLSVCTGELEGGIWVSDSPSFGGPVVDDASAVDPSSDSRPMVRFRASLETLQTRGWKMTGFGPGPLRRLVRADPCDLHDLWQDEACGLWVGTLQGFADLWDVDSDTVTMEILCPPGTGGAYGDPHMPLAMRAMDACENGCHAMAAVLAETIVRGCMANAASTIDEIPAWARPFACLCLGGLQDLTPDIGEVEQARRCKLAIHSCS